LTDTLTEGIETEGFSLVEVISTCPTCYGKWNPPRGAKAMMDEIRKTTKKLGLGVFARRDRPEMTERWREVQEKAGWKPPGEGR
jgi:pyruvate/2-oxoacid:ferredoxin oxidoreductase beta subunit